MEQEKLKSIEKDPLRCTKCGSDRIQLKAWVKPNLCNDVVEYCGHYDEEEDNWCDNCMNNVTIKPESELIDETQEWFGSLEFKWLERVTGFRQFDFSPKEGFQKFVDACHQWWDKHCIEEKVSMAYEFENE